MACHVATGTRGYPIKIRVKADLAKKNNCECLSFSIASSMQRLRSKISHGNPEVRVPLFTTLTAAEALCMAKKTIIGFHDLI